MGIHYKKMGLRLLLMAMAIVSYLPAWADGTAAPVTQLKVTYVQNAMTATDLPSTAPSGQSLVLEIPQSAGELYAFAVYSGGKLVEGCTKVTDATKSTLTIPAVTADIEIYLQGYYVYDKDSWLSYWVVPAGWYSEKGYAMVAGRKYSRDLVRYTVLESITYDGKAYDVRSIHADAFKDGDSENKLYYLMLPASIDTIGARAFEDCSDLSVICVKNPKAVYVSDGAFAGVDRAKCTVYVPKGNLAAYKDWGGFTSIKEQVPYKVTYTLTNLIAREPKAIAYSGEDFTLKLDIKYPGETIRSTQTDCSLGNSIGVCDFSFRDTTLIVNAEFITKDFDVSVIARMACEENNMLYTLDMDNKLAETFYYEEGNLDSSPLVVIPQNFTYKDVEYTVNKIGYQTFGRISGNVSKITSVTIPGSITYIGYNAFDKCSKLTEIHLKDKSLAAVKLETDCFKGINTGKCTVYVPKGTKANFSSTGWKVFEIAESDEYSVTKALANLKGTIPENAKRGKDFTFTLEKKGGQDIAELALEIRIAGKLIPKSDYTSPSGSLLGEFTIPAKAITGDVKITATGYIDCLEKSMTYHLDIDNKLGKTVGLSAGTSVTSFEIPQAITYGPISVAITTIGSRTFKGADLTSVTIPGSIKVIEDEVFDGCRNLTAIYLKDASLATATVSENSFKGMNKGNCTVFVPKGSDKAAFAKVWSGFKDIKDSDQCTVTCEVSKNIKEVTLLPVKIGTPLSFTLELIEGHPDDVNLPDSITINGVQKADWFTYNNVSGVVSILKVETDLVIKATEFVKKKTVTKPKEELKDQVIKEVEIPKDQTVELSLTGVESETINVVEGANATIKLAGEVNLGAVTNSGTMTLDAAEGAEVKYTSIANEGTFTDNTGSITKVTGNAALEITPQPASSEIKPGGKLTVEAPGADVATVSYTWEKQNEDGSWTQKKPLPETKPALLTTKSALSLRAAEADNEFTINKGDEGTYRCKVKREVEVEVNGVKTTVTTTLTTKTDVTTKADLPSVPSIANYSITLPSVEGAATNPFAGLYTVTEGESFAFTLTLDKEYDQSKPVVKAGDQVIAPTADGKYEIKSVGSDLTISITGITKNAPAVGNAEVETDAVRAWASDGALHIYSPRPTTAYIVSFDGKYKMVSVAGEITISDMPKGIYVIRIKDKSFKIAL